MSNKDKAKSEPVIAGEEKKPMSYANYKQALQNDHTIIKLRAEIAQYRLMEFMNLSQLANAQGEMAARMQEAEKGLVQGDPSEAPDEAPKASEVTQPAVAYEAN